MRSKDKERQACERKRNRGRFLQNTNINNLKSLGNQKYSLRVDLDDTFSKVNGPLMHFTLFFPLLELSGATFSCVLGKNKSISWSLPLMEIVSSLNFLFGYVGLRRC